MSTPLQLCILMRDDVAMAFKREKTPIWQRLLTKGEAQYRHQGKKTALADILADLSSRLCLQDKLKLVQVTILFADSSHKLLEDSIRQLHLFHCSDWQIRPWQDIYQQACRLVDIPVSETMPDADWVMKYVLPLVEQNPQEERKHAQLLGEMASKNKELAQSLQNQKSATEKNHADMLKIFDAEKHKLLNEMSQLRLQNAALERPGLEVLLSFLPAIFKDFWNKVRPDELAMMAGKLDTPNIPSPYHSPGMEAVLNKKRHFQQLGAPEQRRVVQFCRDMRRSHAGLQVHPEFLSLIAESD